MSELRQSKIRGSLILEYCIYAILFGYDLLHFVTEVCVIVSVDIVIYSMH